MDTHNFLIFMFYLWSFGSIVVMAIRGEVRLTKAKAMFTTLLHLGMTAAIFATGDPSSWQAVVLIGYWLINLIYSQTTMKESTSYLRGGIQKTTFVVLGGLLILPFMLLGLNIPSA